MNNTVVIPKEEYTELKNRLHSLEEKVAVLIEKVEEDDIFHEFVNSQAFEIHKNATIELYKKDPSRFVDPFETFQKNA